MIKVEFDKFDEAHSASRFVIEMQAVPRKGEGLWIERRIFPSTYDAVLVEDYLYKNPDDLVSVKVLNVYHKVTVGEHTIEVDFDFD